MATPAYATDLVDIYTDSATFNLISAGGGGQNALTNPETDDFIQGTSSVSRNPFSSSIRGMDTAFANNLPTAGDAVFIWWKADVAAALAAKASGGVRLGLGTGSGALYMWYVAGSDTYERGGWVCTPIDYTTTHDTTFGSPGAKTTLTAAGVMWNVPASGPTKGFPFKIDAIRQGRDITLTAGDAGDPATWAKLATYADFNGNPYRRWGIVQPSATGANLQGRTYWGSGSAGVYSRDSNRTVVLVDTQGFVATNFTQIHIQHAATDLEWNNITFLKSGTTNRGDVVIDTATNPKAWLLNCTFADINTTTAGGTNTKFDGSVWRRANGVAANGASFLDAQVLESTVAADASALVWNVAADPSGKLDGMSFSKGAASHHAIELGLLSPLTINLVGIDFSGFTNTVGSTAAPLHIKRTSGTVTINASGCTGLTTDGYKSDGATVNIVLDQVSATFTGIPAGAEVRLYVDDPTAGVIGSTELQGTESHGGGNFVYTYSYSGDTNAVLQVIHTGYLEELVYLTLGATSQTRAVTLEPEGNL